MAEQALNVCTIGTFDMLHVGHVALFQYCREIADAVPGSKVVVGVNSDQFVFRYKSQFPVVNLTERLEMVASCRYVDAVGVNPQDGGSQKSVKSFLAQHHVGILVVGSDWQNRDYLGQIGLTSSEVEELGLEIRYKPYHQGVSSTDLKARILSKCAVKPPLQEGEGTLVVIPAHNPGSLLKAATQGLSSYVVVDNDSADYSGYEGIANVECNMFGPSYEMGALLHAFTKYRYDRYLLIQDSIELREKGFVDHPESFFRSPVGVFALSSIHPASMGMRADNFEWIRQVFPEFAHFDYSHPGIQYNTFSATRAEIQKLVDAGYLNPERLPRSKAGSESWERILGLAFLSLGIPLHFFTTCSNTDHPVFKKTFMYRQ